MRDSVSLSGGCAWIGRPTFSPILTGLDENWVHIINHVQNVVAYRLIIDVYIVV